MHGIDISHWDWNINVANIDIDFCIIKATEGTSYIDPTFHTRAATFNGSGKLWGAYHFASTEDARAEARHFHATTGKYNAFLPVLDFETDAIDYPDRWVREFRDEYRRLAGATPTLYVSASWCPKFGANVSDTMPLWIAGYPRDFPDWPEIQPPYDISPWRSCIIWQFASDWRVKEYSGTLDANVAYIDRMEWMRLCKTTATPQKPLRDIGQIATEVIDGEWGNGEDRKNRLTAAGYDYNEVQSEVNRILGVAQKSISQLATEVIDGKWGNGAIRRAALTGAGYNYDDVQAEVNRRYGIR